MPEPLPPVLTGLASVAANYDGFIFDLWGCLHNGVKPYPGVIDALTRLRGAGKRVLILSNAPRRASAVAIGMDRLGLVANLYDAILSSGEMTWDALAKRSDPWHAALGTRCFKIGPERDNSLLEDNGLVVVATPDQADFVVVTGPIEDLWPLAAHEDVLAACRRRGLKMVCANPDLEVMRGEDRLICAGEIAARYAALGGEVRYHGKPYPETYARAATMLGGVERRRVLAVGDSLRTDIAGARGAHLDSAFIPGGIHHREFGVAIGDAPQIDDVARVAAAAGTMPTYVLDAVRW